MSAGVQRFGVAVSLLLAVALRVTAEQIRGLNPALATKYKPVDGKFSCLDGSKVIPFDQLNDGYCDCLDGSDEPGTPACPNGTFYCSNVWYMPQVLNSSSVDDGVCDCCDGTDESVGNCINICKQKGEEALSGLTAELADAKAGLAERRKYIKEAATARAQWDARLKDIAAVEPAAEQRKQRAASKRDRLEQQERMLLARKSRLEALLKPPEPAAAETAQPASDIDEEQEGNGQAGGGIDEESAGADPFEHPAAAEDDEPASTESETSEDLAKRVASQWIPGGGQKEGSTGTPDSAPSAALDEPKGCDSIEHNPADPHCQGAERAVEAEAGDSDEAVEMTAPAETSDGSLEAEDDRGGDIDLSMLGKAAKWAAGAWARALGKGQHAAELKRTEAALASLQHSLGVARKEATDASSAADVLASEKAELAAKVAHDYGPDGAYVPLATRCVETFVDNKYTYRVCPFSRAEQVENGIATSLGTWAGFDEDLSHLKFTGGQGCWQGPARTMTVAVVCKRGEALDHVAEPSRCEYVAQMSTPAACSERHVAALSEELQRRRSLMKSTRDEL